MIMKLSRNYLKRLRKRGEIPGLSPETNLPDYSSKLNLYFDGGLLKKKGTNQILNFDPLIGLVA